MDADSPATIDALLRLTAAVVVGALIGVDRELRRKPLGARTMALVSLGAAIVCVATVRLPVLQGEPDASSRVVQGLIQGVMTGVGFLGAGVVIQRPGSKHVHGLTTAAAIWVAAALGVACGVASWPIVAGGVALTLLVLVGLRPFDRWLEARGEREAKQEEPQKRA